MFRIETGRRSRLTAAFELGQIIYHLAVQQARGRHSNVLLNLLNNIATTALFIAAFYFTMTIFGYRSNGFRGDFIVFLMSGVMSYVTYFRTMKAIYGAQAPASATLLHGPKAAMAAIASSAVSALYLQVLSVAVILFVYHIVFTPVVINDPRFAFAMLLASWMFGIATGLALLALRLWAPNVAPMLQMIITRINLFASGKTVVGNTLSFSLLKFFDWNPLFHIIDQMRGAIFINYIPRNSSVPYIFYVSLALLVLGMMGEFFARRSPSLGGSTG